MVITKNTHKINCLFLVFFFIISSKSLHVLRNIPKYSYLEMTAVNHEWSVRIHKSFLTIQSELDACLCLTYSSGLPRLCWRPPFLFMPLFLSPYSAGIAVGFYGNGETCDGVNRLTYSLRHANRTVSGVDRLVRHWYTLDYIDTVLNLPKSTPELNNFSDILRSCIMWSVVHEKGAYKANVCVCRCQKVHQLRARLWTRTFGC